MGEREPKVLTTNRNLITFFYFPHHAIRTFHTQNVNSSPPNVRSNLELVLVIRLRNVLCVMNSIASSSIVSEGVTLLHYLLAINSNKWASE